MHGLLKHVPWATFERLVDEHGADARVRRLTTQAQFVALLYGQLAGAASLREIETALSSHAVRLYHLGGAEVSRSTLADANALRPAAVFSDLFAQTAAQAGRGLKRKIGEAVRLIDSTGVRLAGLGAEWARFSAKLDAAGCRVVTRFKANTPLHLLEENPVAAGSPVLSDRVGFLPPRQANSRKNPWQVPVREIRVTTETGKTLRILSNDLDAPAKEIAALYKRRWAIELFFRWVKQTLKIKHFIGRSENAMRIQIAVALIAFLLLRLAQAAAKTIESPLAFARLVRANLMHRRRIDALLEPPPPIIRDPRQLAFSLSPI